jgi:hypothetical protein
MKTGYVWVAGLLVVAGLALVGCGDGTTAGGGRALIPEGEVQVQQIQETLGGGVHAVGEVRNTSTRPYTGTLQVTLKDGAGKIVGSAAGAVNDVPPGGTMPYTAIGTTPTGAWEKVEVAITAQFPTPS